ncbi:hypothetical protein AYI70_g9406, partial [Smittium culicis]
MNDDDQKMIYPLNPNCALNLNLYENLAKFPNAYIWIHKDVLVNSKFYEELFSNNQIKTTDSGVYLNDTKYNPLAVLRIIEFLYYGSCIDFGVLPINK